MKSIVSLLLLLMVPVVWAVNLELRKQDSLSLHSATNVTIVEHRTKSDVPSTTTLASTHTIGIISNSQRALQEQSEDEDEDSDDDEDQCSISSIHEFEASIVLDLHGYPSSLTWLEKMRIGNAIMLAYNELVDCGIAGQYRQIQSTQVVPVTFQDIGDAIFTLEYVVRGSCQGCSSGSHDTTVPRLFTYITGDADSVTDTCPCKAPSILNFRVLLKQRIEDLIQQGLADNVVELDLVSEVVSAPTCPEPINVTRSNIVVALYGCPAEMQDEDFLDLGMNLNRVYNRINGLNAKYCDRFLRQFISAEPVSFQGGSTNFPTGRDRRHLYKLGMSDPIMAEGTRGGRGMQAGSTPPCVAEYFEVRFEVSAICRGCDISTITLFDEPEDANLFERFLYDTRARNLNIEERDGGAELFGSDFDLEDASESRSLSEGSDCRCPLDPTFRAVTEHETNMAFNATISRLFPLILVDLYQVLPVPCNLQIETFGTTVEVDFEFESVDGVISQGDSDALIQRFLTSYNALQGRYCDPYFREVATAQIVDQNVSPTVRDRSLRIRQRGKFTVTIRIAVVGTCRGCGTNGKLFGNDAVKRRLHVSEKRMFPTAETNARYRRMQSDSSQCFCAVANVANSAPTASEFVVGYNQGISGLAGLTGSEYVLIMVTEDSDSDDEEETEDDEEDTEEDDTDDDDESR